MNKYVKNLLAFFLTSTCYLGLSFSLLWKAIQSESYLFWLGLIVLVISLIPAFLVRGKVLAGFIHFIGVVGTYVGFIVYLSTFDKSAGMLLIIAPGVFIYGVFAMMITITLAAAREQVSSRNSSAL